MSEPIPNEDDYMTAPLETIVGVSKKPMDQMSEEEKRLHVVYLQQLRQSFQTFKSEVERVSKDGPSRRKVDLTDMEDVL